VTFKEKYKNGKISLIKMAKYWFRKRRGLLTKDLGWGYRPICLEGWISVIVFVILVVLLANIFELSKASFVDGFGFLLSLLVSIVIFHVFAKNKTRG
jgi:hypothetical protein